MSVYHILLVAVSAYGTISKNGIMLSVTWRHNHDVTQRQNDVTYFEMSTIFIYSFFFISQNSSQMCLKHRDQYWDK